MTRLLALVAVVFAVALIAHSDEQPAEKDSKAKEVAKDKEAAKPDDASAKKEKEDPEKIDWKKVDWRKRLTRMQYEITREAGTEHAFKNKYWNFFKPGEYVCVSCGLPLFESDAKFDSECGWPSFDQTVAKDTVTKHKDMELGHERVEIRCRRCAAHLGHVFNDGPTRTGQRYCMNSVAMKFVPEKKKAKDKPADAEKPKTDEKKTAEKKTEAKP